MKNEKFILLGKSGSGKDFLLKGLIEKGERYSPKITTRPPRDGEVDGVDYLFTENRKFEALLYTNQIKVYQKFIINGVDWYYGITKENFDTNNVFIMTPEELSQLSAEDRKKCFVTYLDIDAVTRKTRIQSRFDNNDSVDRRISADDLDFKNFGDYDLKLTDPEFEIDLVYNFAF
jgi:guanylate kinase